MSDSLEYLKPTEKPTEQQKTKIEISKFLFNKLQKLSQLESFSLVLAVKDISKDEIVYISEQKTDHKFEAKIIELFTEKRLEGKSRITFEKLT